MTDPDIATVRDMLEAHAMGDWSEAGDDLARTSLDRLAARLAAAEAVAEGALRWLNTKTREEEGVALDELYDLTNEWLGIGVPEVGRDRR